MAVTSRVVSVIVHLSLLQPLQAAGCICLWKYPRLSKFWQGSCSYLLFLCLGSSRYHRLCPLRGERVQPAPSRWPWSPGVHKSEKCTFKTYGGSLCVLTKNTCCFSPLFLFCCEFCKKKKKLQMFSYLCMAKHSGASMTVKHLQN